MASTLAVSYNNSGNSIAGTTQYGLLAIGTTDQDYSSRPGNVVWWSTPDLDEMYVIAFHDSTCSQPTPIDGVTACVGFWGSVEKTEESFISLANSIPPRSGLPEFITGIDAHSWLISNGYWSSFGSDVNTPETNYIICSAEYISSLSPSSISKNTIDTAPTYDVFSSKNIINENKTQFEYVENPFLDAYENKLEFIKINLPNYKGDMTLVNLRKNNWVSDDYKIVYNENGLKKIKIEKSKFNSYEIFNDEGIIGGLLIQSNNFVGTYTLSGETSTIYKLNDRYSNVIKYNTDDSDFSCEPLDLESLDLESLEIEINNLRKKLSTNDATTDNICIGLLYEIPYNMYLEIMTNATYTVQEFVEIQNSHVNQIYNTSPSNGNFNFSIAAIVQYETYQSDPYKLSANTLSYPVYLMNLYTQTNSGYMNLDYDFLVQLNKGSLPSASGLGGVAYMGGIYDERRVSANFYINVYNDLTLENSNIFYNLKVVSHEIGHGMGAHHTWATPYYYRGIYTTFIPQCAPNECDNDIECKTVMSYCQVANVSQLKFHPVRMSDMYNFLNNFGEDLFCTESTPEESYIILSIDETNLISNENLFTVSFKSCTASTYGYQYQFDFLYSSFPLTILISDLQTQLISDCYDFLITEILTSTECTSSVGDIVIGDSGPPAPLLSPPSPSPTPVETGIRTLFVKYNSL